MLPSVAYGFRGGAIEIDPAQAQIRILFLGTGVRLEWPFCPPLEWLWSSAQRRNPLPAQRESARVLGPPTGHPTSLSERYKRWRYHVYEGDVAVSSACSGTSTRLPESHSRQSPEMMD
jgi:hypothetical protein